MIENNRQLAAALDYIAKWADMLEGMRRHEAERNGGVFPVLAAGPLHEIRANLEAARAFARAESKPDNMEQQVKGALAQAFAGSELELDTSPDGRYSGLLIWEGFEDQDSIDRHLRVKQALDDLLKEDAENVGMLFTYTPREMAAMRSA